MVIFYSYVGLPEGTINHGFPMVFLWFSNFPMVFPWFTRPGKSEQLTDPPWHGSGPASAPLPRSRPIGLTWGECPTGNWVCFDR